MDEKTVRTAEEIRADWLAVALTPSVSFSEERAPDDTGRELRFLQILFSLQGLSERLDLAPIGKETIAEIAAESFRGVRAGRPQPNEQEALYSELIAELLESGRAGKFAETLIASISKPNIRDAVGILFVARLVEAGCINRARTAVTALEFAAPFARFQAALTVANTTGQGADFDRMRALVAPIEDVRERVLAYLGVFGKTEYHGDLLMAKAAADNAIGLDRARGQMIFALCTSDIDATAACWLSIQELNKGEEKTKLVLQMISLTVFWSVGAFGLPKFDDERLRRAIEAVPVPSWRAYAGSCVAEAKKNQE
jgi:hypothetical protein